MSKHTFLHRLTADEWDGRLEGWSCPILKLPGAEITHAYADGELPQGDWAADPGTADGLLKWTSARSAPEEIVLNVSLDVGRATKADRLLKLAPFLSPILVALIGLIGGLIGSSTKECPSRGDGDRIVSPDITKVDGDVEFKVGDVKVGDGKEGTP